MFEGFQIDAFKQGAFQMGPFYPPPFNPDRTVITIAEFRFTTVPPQPIYEYDDGLGRTIPTEPQDRTVIVVYESDWVSSTGGPRLVTVAPQYRFVVVSADEPVTIPERSATVSFENRTVVSNNND